MKKWPQEGVVVEKPIEKEFIFGKLDCIGNQFKLVLKMQEFHRKLFEIH